MTTELIVDPEPYGSQPCERCGGSGWIAVEDPILGDNVLARCPECGP